MRMSSWRSFLSVLAATLLLLVAGGPSLHAQSDSFMYDPTMQRGSLFGPRINSGPRIIAVPRVRAPLRRALIEPGQQRIPSPSPDPIVARPKVDPVTFVVVLGDTLAELLAGGLDEALGDTPTAVVIRKSRPDSGLVRADFHDWPKVVRELLAGDQKISLAVMLIGSNDRQAIREGDVTHEPLSERWRVIYQDRVDAIAQAFAERRIPLVWVGAPPMQNQRLSADLAVINDIYRQRVERAGGTYVDLWQGFVDAENRYSTNGADLTGQIARLRTGDGVHFTRSGARKAAHFADVALRRLLPDISTGPVLAAPGSTLPLLGGPDLNLQTTQPQITQPLPIELQPGGVDRLIDQMARLGTGLEPIALPVIRVKPIAGPVLPLTGPALSTGGALLPSMVPRGTLPGVSELERVFAEGRAPVAAPGRADDFRWPRPQ